MTNFEKIKNMTIDELSQFLLQRDSYVRLFGSSSKWAISDWLEKDVAVCERFKNCLHKMNVIIRSLGLVLEKMKTKNNYTKEVIPICMIMILDKSE